MNVTPIHYHRSKVYDNTNIILLLAPALIFFIVITIYLTTISTPKSTKDMASTTIPPNVLGEENIDNTGKY